jgi:Ca-activated chloride channel homolog
MLFLVLFLAYSSVAAAQTASFRVDASYIKVPVTVFDSQGRLTAGLSREDFRILDEGQERQIENFILDKTPLDIVLLLDVSGSLQEEIEEMRDAAVLFARSFSKDDSISAVSFADRTEILQEWSDNWKDIRKSLRRLKPGYRTALYDALKETTDRLRPRAGKRVILLLTDGLDNESRSSFDDVLEELIKNDISLYIVSRTRLVRPQVAGSARVEFLNRVMQNVLNSDEDFIESYFREKETALRQLAEVSGGRVFFPLQLHELSANYEQIAEELKFQYLLTFRPPESSEKQFRNLQVICLESARTVHYRQQYRWPSRQE